MRKNQITKIRRNTPVVPLIAGYECLQWSGSTPSNLVEAAGIEPASANPPPLALHAYSVIHFNRTLPDGQGSCSAIPVMFNESTPDEFHRDLVRVDPCDLSAQARIRQRALRLVIKQLVRSCRRWQLNWLQLDLRGNLFLGMHLGFCDPRRSQVAPKDVHSQ